MVHYIWGQIGPEIMFEERKRNFRYVDSPEKKKSIFLNVLKNSMINCQRNSSVFINFEKEFPKYFEKGKFIQTHAEDVRGSRSGSRRYSGGNARTG